MSIRIGIDVGGTNTDAALMENDRVLAVAKQPTSADVSKGIESSLVELLEQVPEIDRESIGAVMIGTTQFTNAVVERKGLAKTAVLRICLPAGQSVPPLYDWPSDLMSAIGAQVHLLHGGYEYDGREISPLDVGEIHRVIENLHAAEIESVAITGVFSPVSAEQELFVAEKIASQLPSVSLSISHQVGRLNMLQRENATVLNACLSVLATRTVAAYEQALQESGLKARLYVSQNDGTLMTADFAAQYPVLTFASGPTNSMRGAAFLSSITDGVVLDVGGTTTDAGILLNSFPREASFDVEVGNVKTNFRMPDVSSFGIGGGSIVSQDGNQVGPRSVGYRITEEAIVFGGQTCTFTDIATSLGIVDLGDRALIDQARATRAMDVARYRLETLIDSLKVSPDPVPVILVGGGSVLFEPYFAGASKVIRPKHSAVANAIGAAIAQVSGEIDRVFEVSQSSRETVLAQAKTEAVAQAVAAGADRKTVEIVEVDEIPLAYLPSNATRIKVKAVGDLASPVQAQ